MQNIEGLLKLGIAETIENQPADPVEYLGLWLLHKAQYLEANKRRRAKEEEMLKTQKAAWEEKEAPLQAEKIALITKEFGTYKVRKAEKMAKEEERKILEEEERIRKAKALEEKKKLEAQEGGEPKPEEEGA